MTDISGSSTDGFPCDDLTHSHRYGQKKVQGMPREYFRCFRDDCKARKQIEKPVGPDGKVLALKQSTY